MNLVKIPGYDGRYTIDTDTGYVYNNEGKQLKPEDTKKGPRVELRHLGQRYKPLVFDLLESIKEADNENG